MVQLQPYLSTYRSTNQRMNNELAIKDLYISVQGKPIVKGLSLTVAKAHSPMDSWDIRSMILTQAK